MPTEVFRDSLDLQLIRAEDLTEDLLVEMAEHFDLAFRGWPGRSMEVTALDHLRWKLSSPDRDAVAYLARLEGRLVSASTVVAAKIRLLGRLEPYFHYFDTAVAPDMQGQGVARYTVSEQRRRSELQLPRALRIGEPQHPFIRRPIARHGEYTLGNRVRAFYRVLEPARCLLEWRRQRGSAGALARLGLSAAAVWGQAADRSCRRRAAEVAVERVDAFDDRVEELWKRLAPNFDLAIERSRDWLDWRYCDARSGGFSIWLAAEGDVCLGYVVGCVREDVGYLADLLLDPGRGDAAAALLERAVTGLGSQGACGISCWLPERHPSRPALRWAGFFDLRDVEVTFRPELRSLEELSFLQQPVVRLHYTIGDTDLV